MKPDFVSKNNVTIYCIRKHFFTIRLTQYGQIPLECPKTQLRLHSEISLACGSTFSELVNMSTFNIYSVSGIKLNFALSKRCQYPDLLHHQSTLVHNETIARYVQCSLQCTKKYN